MIYDYNVLDYTGNTVSMKDFKGKVLLIVNTATGCGFTPQYESLQRLYNKYRDCGLEILDFPCNGFFEQAPGTNDDIQQFCKLNYKTTFNTFSKIEVNGENAHPLYKFLRKEAPVADDDEESIGLYHKLETMGFKTTGDQIKWNFTKFLVDREGNVLCRFSPSKDPLELEKEIKTLL